MAHIAQKISKRIKNWFGYYSGPLVVYTGREFAQGPGFNVSIDVFQITKFGIRLVKNVKVDVDPQWLDSLRDRMQDSNLPHQ